MTGMQRSSSDLDVRRRKALFRSWHRGIREMDLVFGRFADSEIETLSDVELDEYEALMEVPDRDVFSWLTGEIETPRNYDTVVFRKIRDFHLSGHDTGYLDGGPDAASGTGYKQ